MLVVLPEMETDIRLSQEEKALSSMYMTLSGMETDVRLMQEEKAWSPMLLTLSEMLTEAKFLQEEKIGGSAEALLGTAVDEDGFHRTASSSAGFWRNTTSERSYPSLRAFRSARYRKVSCSASVAGP